MAKRLRMSRRDLLVGSGVLAASAAFWPQAEASPILCASRLRALWQISAPLLRTSVIATWCFIFVGLIRELSATTMLFTSETKVLPVLIYDLNKSGDLAAIAVLGLLMLVLTFSIVAVANSLALPFVGVRRLAAT